MNRDFEQVLAGLATLAKMRLFRPDLSNILRIMIQETRTRANFKVLEAMHGVEQDDWGLYGRLRRRWEKKYEDPGEILIQAEELKEQRRGAGKKGV